MSPETTTAVDDRTEVIQRVLARRFPRSFGAMVIDRQGPRDLVRLAQPSAEELVFQITLAGRTAVLTRVHPQTYEPWPDALPEQVVIPEPPPPEVAPDPHAPAVLAAEARTLAEQLSRATLVARAALQHVALTVEEEVPRLLGTVDGFAGDPARARLTQEITRGLTAAQTFDRARAAAEHQLDRQHTRVAAQADALATQRLRGSIREVAALRDAEQQQRDVRLSSYPLADAAAEAQVFAPAVRSAALILAHAGAAAMAAWQAETTALALAHLKVQVARVRQAGLTLDPVLVAAVTAFGQHTGQPVPVPTLMWKQPKDLFAGPSLAE